MSQTFSCIIIDDEEYAIGMLSESLKGLYSNIQIMGCYSSWKDGLQAMRTQDADLVFLDMSLDGKSGLELLSYVPDIHSEVIFITAHAEYALEAFKFSVSGYVVKPIKDADLIIAVNKATERIKYKRLSVAAGSEASPTKLAKIGIPSGSGIDYINVQDILYVEALKGYTKVITQSGELLTSYRIGKFKEILAGHSFFQVHRSYIVNLDFILRYNSTGGILMKNKQEIPMARNMRDEFLRLFNTVSGRDREEGE